MIKLDIDPQRDDNIPDVDIKVHVETYLNVDFSSSAQVKIQVKFNFKLFLKKKIKFFGSHVVVGSYS